MRFSEFLKDGSGRYSATRFGFVLWVIGVLIVWVYSSVMHPDKPQGIDPSILTLIGILMSGKVVQSFSPNDGPAVGGGSQTGPEGDATKNPSTVLTNTPGVHA